MLLYVVIWSINVIHTDSFILQDSYNIMMRESVRYNVDESLGEDFEMINREQIRALNIEDKNNELYDLNRIASKEYVKTSRKPINMFNLDDLQSTTVSNFVSKFDLKLAYTTTTTTHSTPLTTSHRIRKRRLTTQKRVYDYDKFLKEYYEESVYEEQHNRSYIPQADESQGLIQLLKSAVRPDTIRDTSGVICLARHVMELKNNSCSYQEMLSRIMETVKIFIMLYIAIAVPLFCMKGWCCCFLCCKFFKPKLIIHDAKQYLIQNPPGILKTGKGTTLYEPTEEERECYAQFDHFIRII